MKLTLEGKVYTEKTMHLYELSLGEAREIKRFTGLTLADWRLGLLTWNRHDPDVLAGVVWLLKHRAGEPVHWDQINMLPAAELLGAFDWSDDQAEMQAALTELLGDDAGPPSDNEPMAPMVRGSCPSTRRFANSGPPRRCSREAGHPGDHSTGKGKNQRTWPNEQPAAQPTV